VIRVRSKDRVDLEAGDILTLYSSGGGGYGPAAERDPRLVARDVAEGYVSPAAAARLYGWTGHT
jgi:N-methylhydantoinase B